MTYLLTSNSNFTLQNASTRVFNEEDYKLWSVQRRTLF